MERGFEVRKNSLGRGCDGLDTCASAQSVCGDCITTWFAAGFCLWDCNGMSTSPDFHRVVHLSLIEILLMDFANDRLRLSL